MTSLSPPKAAPDEARRKRTIAWVVGLATLGLIFDGYDLVVYGTVVSTFLRHPDEIGAVTPAAAGALGSYALVGVLWSVPCSRARWATSSAAARSCWPATPGSPSS